MFSIEFLSGVVGLLLTLLIFSYLIGDNPLFRFALYLFIGVASGYGATVVWHYVLVPKLFTPLGSGDLSSIIPLLLSVTLLAKLSPRISWIGNFAMAILVGVGAAAAVGGAVIGTIIPQVQAAIDAFDIRSTTGAGNPIGIFVEGSVLLAGTIFTLGYFQFTAGRAPDGTPKRGALFEGVAFVGRIFIAITLGVLFAGVYMAALTAMIERLSSIINFIRQMAGL